MHLKKYNLNTATEPEVISNGDKLHKEEDLRRRKGYLVLFIIQQFDNRDIQNLLEHTSSNTYLFH